MNNQTKTVAFHTLGCKLNFSETSTIARNLKDSGYQKVEFTDSANVYIINTCSVTANADKEYLAGRGRSDVQGAARIQEERRSPHGRQDRRQSVPGIATRLR